MGVYEWDAFQNNGINGTTADITGTAATEVLPALPAGQQMVITDIIVSNLSSTVACRVDILDGSSVVVQLPAPKEGGAVLNLTTPILITENNNVQAQCSVTGAQVRVTAIGYKFSN